ncbi:RagB/SusD family nutrient uptake outer membrane protein [Parapedobacter sp. ISTM3]|uniref:Starch-binding associating with outer membrane n=1 Tax=Parapedobacter luteus TaxID=623280 RepID=A0A1T5DQU1_9SPHI|nr:MULTISPECIES: RagB/SusD family nutrient uptake outer membrane protein [Parapedobacter]MBK1440892.1 RagB/SusD family nutrient uptake outer membrane protein [Parapedobacter sp. ISTM3]SKB73803.1 Starch-binding associating with outer membrane [Parapedobacter luteus]
MKTIIKKIGALTVVAVMASCADTLLDKEPISNFSAQGFYKNTSDAQAGVYGIYNAFQSAFRLNFALWGEGRADAVGSNAVGDPAALRQNTLTPIINSARWDNLYTVISRANYAIKYIPQVFGGADSPLRNQLLGQAYALRAIAYFYAVRVWGDVPLILEPYESIDQELFVRKTDREAVLDQIEEDLTFASVNCAASYGGERDRVLITRGGADAFLTHVYMWRKDYANAIAAAERVMDNPLYSLVTMGDWTNVFAIGLSSESIFEVGYNEVQTNSLRILYALGSDSYYFPSERFMNSFEEGDLRRPRIYDITAVQPRMVWKFFGEGFNDESPDPSANNIVLVRLADIMLLKAEAHARSGQPEEALPLLNEIRERAGLASLDQATAESLYGDIESAILHERSIELSFEGHRWFDLVRTGRAIEIMQPINGLRDEANILWPIHEEAINRNPNLEQNEFYR